jgi:hypothetical protein
MLIVKQKRAGFRDILVEIPGAFWEVVGLEIVAIHVQPIVNNRSDNPFAGYPLQPQSCHIEIVSGLQCIEKVPLFSEDRVSDS